MLQELVDCENQNGTNEIQNENGVQTRESCFAFECNCRFNPEEAGYISKAKEKP